MKVLRAPGLESAFKIWGAAAVRLAPARATVPQIATSTGHSLKNVEAIFDAHDLGRDVQLAAAAVLKLEREQNRRMSCGPRLVVASAQSPSA
jgi:hypothetical protein